MKRYYSLFVAAAALLLVPATVQAQTSNNSASYAKPYAATSSSQAAAAGDAFVLTNAAGDTVLYAAPTGEVVAGNPGGFAGTGEGFVSIMERPGAPSAGIFQTLNPENVGVNLYSFTYGQGPSGVFSQLNDTSHAAAVLGLAWNMGAAGGFEIHNTQNNYSAVFGLTRGLGPAGNFNIDNAGNGASAVRGVTTGIGPGGFFEIWNAANTSPALHAFTSGTGTGAFVGRGGNGGDYGPVLQAYQEGTAGFAPAVHAQIVNVNNDSPVIDAYTTGLGSAGSFTIENSGNNAAAVSARTNGSGSAGYFELSDSTSGAVALWVNNFGDGPSLEINKDGSGDIAVFRHQGDNKMVIAEDGNIYADGTFNGGGADVAEAFDVEGSVTAYSPGDVLVISTRSDRTVERSQEPYSTLVAGVYATKPGLLLSEKGLETDMNTRVPMGVVGVLPTKVTLEGGAIERGDMLVTSSTPGAAMKANPERVQVGQVIGKALQGYDGEGEAVIKVLVSVR